MGVHLPEKFKSKSAKTVVIGGTAASTKYTGTVYSNYKSCKHDGSTVVYEKDGKQLFASSWSGLEPNSGKWDLIIDLASNVKTSTFVKPSSSERFRALSKYVLTAKGLPSELLALEWQDMGYPPVTYDFWVDLWNMLPATTVIACMGGHGRTGTCIAALMMVNGVGFEDAITQVRKDHCSKAVESLSQMQYLHGMGLVYLSRAIVAMEAEGKDASELIALHEWETANPPTFSSNSATKAGSYALTPVKSYGVLPAEINKTEITISGTRYVKECAKATCGVYKCDIVEHQLWILPADSIYDAVGELKLLSV